MDTAVSVTRQRTLLLPVPDRPLLLLGQAYSETSEDKVTQNAKVPPPVMQLKGQLLAIPDTDGGFLLCALNLKIPNQLRIHDNRIHRNVDNIDAPCTTFTPAILTATTTMNDNPQSLQLSPALTTHATSSHASAWSVTCKSIAQRQVNQYLELRHTVTMPASTALIAPATLHATWTY
ncbi:unnamed protein product [Schistocephalus solidus]|uniref:Uncharacterized protein n=1 Tax=Schistocephalus solidus TaxID=70667 RepID=A0A183SV10_SCHSO|nr:unnamed protein product [Schistocephalus solidus]